MTSRTTRRVQRARDAMASIRELHAVALEFDECLTSPPGTQSRLRTVRDEARLAVLLADERVQATAERSMLWWMHDLRVLGPGPLPQLPDDGDLTRVLAHELVGKLYAAAALPMDKDPEGTIRRLMRQAPGMVRNEALVAGAQCFLWGLSWAGLSMRDVVALTVVVHAAAGDESPIAVSDLLLGNLLLALMPVPHRHERVRATWRRFFAQYGEPAPAGSALELLGCGLSAEALLGHATAIVVAILARLGLGGVPEVLELRDADDKIISVVDIGDVDPTPPPVQSYDEHGFNTPGWAAGLSWRLVTSLRDGDMTEQQRLLGLVDGRRDVGAVLVAVMAKWVRDALDTATVPLPRLTQSG